MGEDDTVLARPRVAAPRHDYDGTLAAIVDLVASIERSTGRTGSVGVGIPGTISADTRRVKNANSTWLNGRPLGDDLRRTLGRPIRIANDANCFALSEATDGAARGAEVVFGVIAGTGTGAGIVIRGHVLDGINGIAGEWGHNPLPWPRSSESGDEWPGPPCYCGRTGCIETFLSGPGLAGDFARSTGVKIAPEQIVALSRDGDAAATACLARYVDRFARAIAHVINILDPGVVVLGGGMSNIDEIYEAVTARWGRYIFSDTVRTQLVKAAHGDSSGVRGAAWLWNVVSDQRA